MDGQNERQTGYRFFFLFRGLSVRTKYAFYRVNKSSRSEIKKTRVDSGVFTVEKWRGGKYDFIIKEKRMINVRNVLFVCTGYSVFIRLTLSRGKLLTD